MHFSSVFLALTLVLVPAVLWAEKVALVIGNSDYRLVASLDNPVNDANRVTDALQAQGFDVTKALNLDLRDTNVALRDFRDRADRAEVALVYYAGHGIEVAGSNYLVPVDAELRDERDAKVELITVDAILDQISGASQMKMVVLDACRNNPFAVQMKRKNKGRSVGQGLGKIETDQADTLIAYAAAAGAITPDGVAGGNSPFTAAFLTALGGPPRDVRRLFGTVRDEMRLTVPGAAPFVYTSLGGGEFVINPNSGAPGAAPLAETPDMLSDFLLADRLATVEQWNVFLQTYKDRRDQPMYAHALAKRDALAGGDEARSFDPEVPVEPRERKEVLRDLQAFLKERGCYRSIVDGVYGPKTGRALNSYAGRAKVALDLSRRPDAGELETALTLFRANDTASCPAPVVTATKPRKTTPKKTTPKPANPPAQAASGSGEKPCLVFEGQTFCN